MSIIKHVTLQKIVAHDFRYDPRNWTSYQVTYCKSRKCYYNTPYLLIINLLFFEFCLMKCCRRFYYHLTYILEYNFVTNWPITTTELNTPLGHTVITNVSCFSEGLTSPSRICRNEIYSRKIIFHNIKNPHTPKTRRHWGNFSAESQY